MPDRLTVGVEEEFHVVDAASRVLAHDADVVLDEVGGEDFERGQFEKEIYLSMVETASVVCDTLDEVGIQLRRLRAELCASAAEHGLRVLASGTTPLAGSRRQQITPGRRYRAIERRHQLVSREMMACGTHVHVGVADRDEAVAVLNHVRPHLPLLLALSANSPFWDGQDTGFSSYRSILWGRWPSADIPGLFADAAEYDAVCGALQRAGAALDPGQIYWDARLSVEQPTVEFRVADVCLSVEGAVLQAALCRALVAASLDRVRRGEPAPRPRDEVLRAAKWRAARFGLSDRLLDVTDGELSPAPQLLRGLLEQLAEPLERHGDAGVASDLLEQVLATGTGAARQRAAFARAGRMQDAIDLVAAETCA